MSLDLAAAFAVFPVLDTERLVLRAIEPADAPAIFAIMADPEVVRYFGRAPMVDVAEAEARVASIREDFAHQSGIRWALTLRTTGELVGTCGFWRFAKEHYRAEIGYELGRRWWGQGLMPEAVGAVLRCGFGTLGLHSVEAQIAPENNGSRRVLEKQGFVQEAYFRENYYEPSLGRFTDTVIFSLLGRDFGGGRVG